MHNGAQTHIPWLNVGNLGSLRLIPCHFKGCDINYDPAVA